MARLVGVVAVVVLAACGRTEPVSPRPIANIRLPPVRFDVDTLLELDGQRSFDPEGEALTFRWRVLERPSGASGELGGFNSGVALLRPDRPGRWRVELVVFADTRTSFPVMADLDVVGPPAMNRLPTAVATFTLDGNGRVLLDGRGSSDPDGDPLQFEWLVKQKPPQSTVILMDHRTPQAWFTPTVAGRYAFELTVNDDDFGYDTENVAFEISPDGGLADAGSLDAGTSDGGSSDGGLITSGRFDPREVYLVGTVQEGACSRDALAHWSTPNVAAVGFGCGTQYSSTLRLPEGRLLYWSDEEVRQFECDGCPFTGQYPSDPTANDPVLGAPCPMGTNLITVRTTAGGEVLYRCGNTWIDAASGAVVYVGVVEPLSIGPDGWWLTRTAVFQPQTGVARPFIVPFDAVLTARWRGPDEFLLAVESDRDRVLWRVTTAGVAIELGTYPALPMGLTARAAPVLDSAGRLFSLGLRSTPGSFDDVIVRQQLGGASTVVYSETSNPLVKIHISNLVTGP